MTTRIAIVLFDGFDELDAIGPYEVLDNAAGLGADLSVSLCTLEPTGRVTGSHGTSVLPDDVLAIRPDDPGVTPDILIVPGGGWNARADTGAWGEVQRGNLPDAVRRLGDRDVTVASVCTGGMIVAASGLADGRPATTHAGAIDDLRDTAAVALDERVVDDGTLVTAGGVTAGLDLALWLVEREFGAGLADSVADAIEYERRYDVRRSGG